MQDGLLLVLADEVGDVVGELGQGGYPAVIEGDWEFNRGRGWGCLRVGLGVHGHRRGSRWTGCVVSWCQTDAPGQTGIGPPEAAQGTGICDVI